MTMIRIMSLLSLFALTTVQTAALEAGAATADLTPEPGVSMDGAISKTGPVRGVHDKLFSRALVLRQGTTTVALVVNDMCMIEQAVCDKAKALVEKKIGIPPNRMLMSATHSHATPRLMHNQPGRWSRRIRTPPAEKSSLSLRLS